MPRDWWAGVIKDYDGGTIMECHMHPTFDFLRVKEIIQQQRGCIHQKVKENSSSHIKRKGLKHFKDGKKKRLKLSQITGVDACRNPEAVAAAFPTDEQIAESKKLFQDIINGLLKLPDIWPFEAPVLAEDAPDYFDVIKDPIDLETIQKRLDTNQIYITEHIFFADLRRMLENCKLYNNHDTIFYKCAVAIEKALTERGWGKYFKKAT